MADYTAAVQGGFKPLRHEALPTVSAATAIFANAPPGTRRILLVIRTQGLTMTFGSQGANGMQVGPTPTASSVGIDYAAGTYEFDLSQEKAQVVQAIQTASTTTGYTVYFGVA